MFSKSSTDRDFPNVHHNPGISPPSQLAFLTDQPKSSCCSFTSTTCRAAPLFLQKSSVYLMKFVNVTFSLQIKTHKLKYSVFLWAICLSSMITLGVQFTLLKYRFCYHSGCCRAPAVSTWDRQVRHRAFGRRPLCGAADRSKATYTRALQMALDV